MAAILLGLRFGETGEDAAGAPSTFAGVETAGFAYATGRIVERVLELVEERV